MTYRPSRWLLLLAITATVGSCQREIVAPGVCPQTCPGGSPVVIDTLLAALQGQDSAYIGYVQPGAGTALLVSSGLSNDLLSTVKFLPRGDSLLVNDTLRTFTVDSVAFRVGLLARDTMVPGLAIDLYRVPTDLVDSTVTYQDLEPFIDDSVKIGSVAVPDSVTTDLFRLVVSDSATLDLLMLAPADSGVMAIAYSLTASQGTGVRVGSLGAAGFGPLFQTYAKIDGVVDTTLDEQTITRIAQFNTFVYEVPFTINDTTLIVGGAPSARSLVRFSLPSVLASRDSSQIIRATLELIPIVPIDGLPNDSANIQARGVQSDLGAKSPRCSFGIGTLCGSWIITSLIEAPLVVGSSDTVSIEVGDLVRGWQNDTGTEPALFLELSPEASSFTIPVFGSSRTPGFEPRLLVTYSLPFPFEER